jgi:SNF2 family DNA or RNA helicase
LSNTTADRYKIIRDLIKRGNPDSVYLATGTPITNNPQNYFNLLQLIGDPVADDREYYLKRYCNAIEIPRNAKEKAKRDAISRKFIANRGKSNWYELTDGEKDELRDIVKKNVRMMTIPNGEGNLDELRDRTAHIYLRRVKEDLKGLPNKTVHELFYDLNMEQTMEYNRLWEEYEAAQLEADPTKEVNKDLLEGAIYRKYLSNQMVPNTIKLTDSFIGKGEKVVIACCYDEELYALRDYYGDKCVIYNGKISAKEKDTNVERFTNDPNVKVLIGNIVSAGVGINLIAARIVIFNNISYVPGDDIQFEDRVYRITQTKDVDIYYQIFRDTQYEKMWNIVLRKSLVINQIVKKEAEK